MRINRGITLVALIITIVILLILAVVAISAVTGNGIIAHAKNARDLYASKSEEENALLQNYLEQLNKEINGNDSSSDGDKEIDGTTVKGSLNKIISTKDNTPLTDDFANKITVPAGFKILVDSTTNYTVDDINVTKGIVVEDEEGNQFVWIPVGEIKNAEKTKTINLERNTFGNEKVTLSTVKFNNIKVSRIDKNYKITTRAIFEPDLNYIYTEGKKNETTTNKHAKDIEEFVSKTNASGGYYIGRYEARTETERKSSSASLTPVTSKAKDYVYNYVTQPQASERCQSMYTNRPYESDLVNSYAWDTAIIFIQEFENNTYSQTSGEASDGKLSNKGLSILKETGKVDKQCNIYDMAGNCQEWSTETRNGSEGAALTWRGGGYTSNSGETSSRTYNQINGDNNANSFRPVLYM